MTKVNIHQVLHLVGNTDRQIDRHRQLHSYTNVFNKYRNICLFVCNVISRNSYAIIYSKDKKEKMLKKFKLIQ